MLEVLAEEKVTLMGIPFYFILITGLLR